MVTCVYVDARGYGPLVMGGAGVCGDVCICGCARRFLVLLL